MGEMGNCRALVLPETHTIIQLWLNHALEQAHRRAHRDNLRMPRPLNDEFNRYVDEMEAVFDFVLLEFEKKYLTIFATLDEKLKVDTPTDDDVSWISKNVPHNQAVLGYFYGRLDNPKWLLKLESARVFERPPEPVLTFDGEGTLISHPSWPVSKCLMRMAAVNSGGRTNPNPRKHQNINFEVHKDILDAACFLPFEISDRIAALESEWLSQQESSWVLISDKVASLVIHLVDGGKVDSALKLSHSVLRFIDLDGPYFQHQVLP